MKILLKFRVIILVIVTFFSTSNINAQTTKKSGNEVGEYDLTLADRICSKGYVHWASSTPVRGFETAILKHIGLPENTPDREKKISKFFNDNNSKLICSENDYYIRENEHILKRSVALSEYDFLMTAANSSKYELDWNFYEIVDGKKETILDYLDMIINDVEMEEEYNINELKSLIVALEEAGAKRGREL